MVLRRNTIDSVESVEGLAERYPKLFVLFERLDINGDGKLDAEEISNMLRLMGIDHGAEAVKEAISEADADGDGEIAFDEFVVIMRRAEQMQGDGNIRRDKSWGQLVAWRSKVLARASIPLFMIFLVLAQVIFSFRYFGSVAASVRIVTTIYDSMWKITGGVGWTSCPEVMPQCSYVDLNGGKHFPATPYLALTYLARWKFLLFHIATVGTAFMIFPFQFWKGLRAWSVETGNGVHKYMGRSAMILLFLGMGSSIPIAGGPGKSDMCSKIGFWSMASTVTFCAGMGWYRARRKHYAEHKKWMIRCFGAMLGGFFAFRLSIPLLSWLPFEVWWPLESWLSWIGGIVCADMYMSYENRNLEKYNQILTEGRAGAMNRNLMFSRDKA